MIRAFHKLRWHIRVWIMKQQADTQLRRLRTKREQAKRQHKRVSGIDAEMRAIRHKGLMT
jgi:hypothetical protein